MKQCLCGASLPQGAPRSTCAKCRAVYQAKAYKAIPRPVMACPECGVVARMTVDHVVKPRDGGSNAASNLRYMCRPCNTKQAGHHPTTPRV